MPIPPSNWRTNLARNWGESIKGFVTAVVAVPDGLAAAAMVGVNPMLGLYTGMVAPLAGGVLASTQRMMICATSASALAAAETLQRYQGAEREKALALLVLMTGGFLVVLGLLRAGRLVRYISHAVMSGFLLGVAVVLVFSQLPQLLGIEAPGGSPIGKLVRLMGRLDQVSIPAVILGGLTLLVLLVVDRTRLKNWAPLIALIIAVGAALLVHWDVEVVGDRADLSAALVPLLPDFSLIDFQLVTSALAVAVIISIQAAGVSQGAPNLDGSRTNVSRDMWAQGAANMAGSLVSAIPAGGSVGQTALSVGVGAKTRWVAVFSGLWMLAIVFLVPGLVTLVPMTVLAALMIVAGLKSLRWREAFSVWRVGGGARWAILVTFLACLATSIPMAVAIGVGVTIAYYVLTSSMDISVQMLIRKEGGQVWRAEPPSQLADRQVTILDIEGSLFFAGARTLMEKLPDPDGAYEPVVVLRLHAHSAAGATLVEVLGQYARRLERVGGALYVSGVNERLAEQLAHVPTLEGEAGTRVFTAQPAVGASTRDAAREALHWLRTIDPETRREGVGAAP